MVPWTINRSVHQSGVSRKSYWLCSSFTCINFNLIIRPLSQFVSISHRFLQLLGLTALFILLILDLILLLHLLPLCFLLFLPNYTSMIPSPPLPLCFLQNSPFGFPKYASATTYTFCFTSTSSWYLLPPLFPAPKSASATTYTFCLTSTSSWYLLPHLFPFLLPNPLLLPLLRRR